MAWAHVKSAPTQNNNFGPFATLALAYVSAVTAGNMLACLVIFGDSLGTVTATVSDSVNGAWTAAVGPTRNLLLGGLGFTQYLFYFPNTAAGTPTVTASFSGAGGSYPRLDISEYSGLATSAVLDVTSAATGNSTALNSGAATTTANNEMIYGGGMDETGDTTVGSGYTSRAQNGDGYDMVEDKNLVTAGSTSVTFGSSTGQWICQMATFKEPGAGGRTTKNTRAFPLGEGAGMGFRLVPRSRGPLYVY